MVNGEITFCHKAENSFAPLKISEKLLRNLRYDKIIATGYGRHLFANHFECDVISEIKAFALGARHLNPNCRTILDIGGQDTKAISLSKNGNLKKFEMNDKCAAGTGKFLEIMAMAMGYTLWEFGDAALSATKAEQINSMCTVFAESEVISMVSRGADRTAVSLGIHQSVVKRSTAMLHKVSIHDEVVFVGGVALNPCIKKLLLDELDRPIFTPEDPQIVGALGCALYGSLNVSPQ
jgi:predicted CoA-substrate-specific enzyme activase